MHVPCAWCPTSKHVHFSKNTFLLCYYYCVYTGLQHRPSDSTKLWKKTLIEISNSAYYLSDHLVKILLLNIPCKIYNSFSRARKLRYDTFHRYSS